MPDPERACLHSLHIRTAVTTGFFPTGGKTTGLCVVFMSIRRSGPARGSTRWLASRLAECAVLECLDRRELRGLAQQATRMTYGEGQPVIVEGDCGVGFYVVLSGCASVSVDGQLRRALRSGDSFGELCLLGRERRSATVVAATDLECAVVAAWCFRALVAVHPCVADALALQAELYDS